MKFSTAEILNILNITDTELPEGEFSISIDTRTVKEGEVYIALKGDAFDGNSFIKEALSKGAFFAIGEYDKTDIIADKNNNKEDNKKDNKRERIKENIGKRLSENKVKSSMDNGIEINSRERIIFIEDTHSLLLELGALARDKHRIPLIAVTGSNGKTTTKELIAFLLSDKYSVLKNRGNLNNHIGLPLTFFDLEYHHNVIVVELGMNHSGELEILSRVARPDIVVITNIGSVHMEFFNSVSDIARAKSEIFIYMDKQGTAYIPYCEYLDILLENCKAENCRIFSVDEKFYHQGELSEDKEKSILNDSNYKNIDAFKNFTGSFFDKYMIAGVDGSDFSFNGKDYHIDLPGEHNLGNALAAFSVVNEFDPEIDLRRISEFVPPDNRSTIEKGRFLLIKDHYNANPVSMRRAVDILQLEMGRKRIAILGDMFEIGKDSQQVHYDLGLDISGKLDILFCYGKDAAFICSGAEESDNKIELFSSENENEIIDRLGKLDLTDSIILLKGSRGMHMERFLPFLEEKLGAYNN